MQVILLEKVVNLGQLGDVVRVKDGFARNFLIPQGMARRAELEKAQAEKLAEAQALGGKMAGLVLEISQKAGVDGRLFGSVTNFDIAEALKVKGLQVAKACVRLPNGPLKTVGDHGVQVAPHTDVVVDVTVRVIGEAA